MTIEVRPGGVSASFTITAESPAHLGQMIRAIGEALEHVEADGPVSAAAATPMASGDWYRENGAAFYGRLRDNARLALRTIIAEGPTVPFAKVNEATGLHGSPLAGSLASVGAAVTALRAPAAPFTADHKRKVYRVEPAVLEALRGVLPTAG
jgi:hypothetical protein